jgi:hypothetical protein
MIVLVSHPCTDTDSGRSGMWLYNHHLSMLKYSTTAITIRARRKQTRRSIGSTRTLGIRMGDLAIVAARVGTSTVDIPSEGEGRTMSGSLFALNICSVVETHVGGRLQRVQIRAPAGCSLKCSERRTQIMHSSGSCTQQRELYTAAGVVHSI